MFRLLILIHRYLGIAIGMLLLLWCVSGFVMLYVQYPELDAREQRQLLPLINLQDCCRLPGAEDLAVESVDYFAIEMVADRPVLRLGWYADDEIAIDLQQGAWLDPVTPDLAGKIAVDFQRRRKLDGRLEYLGEIEADQWTVYGGYQPHRPLHHYAAHDAAGTEWYVSSTAGTIIQITTAHERFWNWLGAVSHWLYFTKLRQDTRLWSRLVIALATLGTFLAVIGISIGIKQFRFRAGAVRRTPYSGWHLWHHYLGLAFGFFTLTWVFSGLLSMNPWGLLEGADAAGETRLLAGRPLPWADVEEFVHALPSRTLPADLARLEVSNLQGERNLVTHYTTGVSRRLDYNDWRPGTISAGQWLTLTGVLQRNTGPAAADMLGQGDEYYFDHHVSRSFPVWRVILADAGGTRYYLDPLTARILEKFDGNRQGYRWLFWALHRGDFSRLLRTKPVWDVFIITLLSGVTVVTATGTYLGIKRLVGRR